MHRPTRPLQAHLSAALCAVLFAAAGCGGGGGGGNTPPTTHAISGTVSGAVTAGVTLTLSGASSGTTTSGAGGSFSFTGLADGTYQITPSLAGYTFTPTSLAVTLSGADASGKDFVAAAVPPPTYSISGTVGGAVAEGVTVTLSGGASRTTVTAAGGGYAFTGLAAGAYTVTPSLAGYTFTPALLSFTLSADSAGRDFTATAVVAGTHAISGTITGAPAGTRVTLSGAADATTTTDGAGAFSFTGLSDGTYLVTPSARGRVFSPTRRAADVVGADVAVSPFTFQALALHDDFSSGGLSGARWESGQRRVYADGAALVLHNDVAAVAANRSYASQATLRPAAVPGQITSVRAAVSVDSSGSSGGATARAGVDLWFQPLANRVAGPDNLLGAVFVRFALVDTNGTLTAIRHVVACPDAACASPVAFGTAVAGATWPASTLTVARATAYTMSMSIDPVARQVAYTISGGAITTPLTATLDLSGITTPFPIDLSATNFYKLRAFDLVRGSTAGGTAAMTARIDDLAVGQDGGALALLDDFNAAPPLDAARWTPGEEAVTVTATPAVQLTLDQAGRPAITTLNGVASPSPSAVSSKVTVLEWSQTGTGQVGARLAGALYNDGSGGLGTAPDVPGAGSQVGDVTAQISMTGTDVSYAVIRCNVAVCSEATGAQLTFLKERTSLGTVVLGEEHELLIRWDDAAHVVIFQLDDQPPVTFDPVAAGFGVAGPAGRPFWQLATHAGAAGPGLDFSAGSSGRIRAAFRAVSVL